MGVHHQANILSRKLSVFFLLFNDDLSKVCRIAKQLFCSSIDHHYSVYWVGGIPLSLHFGLRVFIKQQSFVSVMI